MAVFLLSVLVCEKPIVFASGKTKQEVTVGDESGTACDAMGGKCGEVEAG